MFSFYIHQGNWRCLSGLDQATGQAVAVNGAHFDLLEVAMVVGTQQ
jgi:hypothetical protein